MTRHIEIEDTERERVKSMLERPGARRPSSRSWACAPAEARGPGGRDDAAGGELSSPGALDALAAGGALTNQDLLLIIILILLS